MKSKTSERPPAAPLSWLAAEAGRTDPGAVAWSLMHWLMVTNKQRLFGLAQEFKLAPQQMIALRILGGGPRKMSELADALFCDNSNVTGIVDRLEEHGLVRREAAEGDRRVKLIVLTEEGEWMRKEITKRMAQPPRADRFPLREGSARTARHPQAGGGEHLRRGPGSRALVRNCPGGAHGRRGSGRRLSAAR